MGYLKEHFCVFVAASVVLAGCGRYVPEKDLLHKNTVAGDRKYSRQGAVEANILANVRCEVTKGLFRAIETGNVRWLGAWGVTISFNLTWEEESDFGTGLIYSDPLGGTKVATLGGGLIGSAEATRTEALTLTWENEILIKEAILTHRNDPNLDCSVLATGATINSNLKIDEFIYDKAFIAGTPTARTRTIEYAPFSTFQETVAFVISHGADITPSWALTRVTVNPSGPFLGAKRTKTSQIIVTLGPIESKETLAGQAELALQARVQHESALIGGSTASAIRSTR
ncbi:hypothetical protein [Rhizobium leguminosarum]|uniref:hypothetical protein n=1 Tax=Rhizobium leguminosarum TaxID=384 RepID=UPI001C959DD4|nr:hypothetical protein [Rhizobium leguminosarum]MBY5619686.1 hypothetical protein [Rhizobium leguminosarum]